MALGQQTQKATEEASAQQIPDAPRPQVGFPAREYGLARHGHDTNDQQRPAAGQPGRVRTRFRKPSSVHRLEAGEGRRRSSTGDGSRCVQTDCADELCRGSVYRQGQQAALGGGHQLARGADVREQCAAALTNFTVDPFPISVAIVVDQSLTYDNMAKVNNSLSALQGAFAPYDEVAVYTYNNGPRLRTTFTGAQSARLNFALETMKRPAVSLHEHGRPAGADDDD